MKKRGHRAAAIDKVIYQNPKKFLGQCPKFEVRGSVMKGRWVFSWQMEQPLRFFNDGRLSIRPNCPTKTHRHPLIVAKALQFDRRALAAGNGAVGADGAGHGVDNVVIKAADSAAIIHDRRGKLAAVL